VWYAGSTERCTFREAGEPKFANLVDLARGSVTPLPLPARPMIELPPLECRGLEEAAIPGALHARLASADLEGAIVKLKVLGIPPHAYAMLDFARIRTLTAAALHFELQPEIARSSESGPTADALGPLADEVDAFLARRPTEDRDALASLAKELLREAEAS
jgi:DNA repair exonuclease SbcCD nuclease subunit